MMLKGNCPLFCMTSELVTPLTEPYTDEDLYEMVDLNPSATDGEVKAKTESIILCYLRVQNQERANFFQEVQRRLLACKANEMPPHVEDQPVPVHRRRQTQLVSIHSQFRTDYYNTSSTDFKFDLPAKQKGVLSVNVAAVELPRTYNTVSSEIGNSTMVVLSKTDERAWLVTLPDGNYDVTRTTDTDCFDANVEAMNTAIQAAIPGTVDSMGRFVASDEVNGLTAEDLTYSVDARTHQSIFTTNGVVDAVRFNVDSTGAVDTETIVMFRIGWALGFRYAEYDFGGSATLTSKGVAFLSGPTYWFISIEDQQHQHSAPFMVAYNEWGISKQIVSRVSVAHDTERRVIRSHLSQPRQYSGPVDVTQLHIKVLDEYGRIVDLNEMDWSLVLEFERLEVGWDEGVNNMVGL